MENLQDGLTMATDEEGWRRILIEMLSVDSSWGLNAGDVIVPT
jgi:hypothetical protein